MDERVIVADIDLVDVNRVQKRNQFKLEIFIDANLVDVTGTRVNDCVVLA